MNRKPISIDGLPKAPRLLAVCPIGIGNLLLLLPALKHLKELVPDAHLSLLALKPGIVPVARRFDFIDAMVSIDANQSMGLAAKLSFIRSLRGRFDASFTFFPSNRLEYNLLPYLASIPRRFAFRYSAFGCRMLSFLNNRRVAVADAEHDLLQNFRLLQSAGLPAPEEPALVPFVLREGEIAYAHEFAARVNPEGRLFIGLHPGSSAEHGMDRKRWSAAAFADLAKKILGKRSVRFLVFGGPEEAALKEEVVSAIGPLATVVRTGSLFETAAVIQRCYRFISNDSGLMHVAACLDVPVCGIFGPTDDRRTAPFGPAHRVVRGAEPCSPCWLHRNVGKREECRYEDYRCLKNLSADDVFGKIEGWLK
ncbi:MAG: glycosyltransferase family 9 protein [Fibrobacterota bacterium]